MGISLSARTATKPSEITASRRMAMEVMGVELTNDKMLGEASVRENTIIDRGVVVVGIDDDDMTMENFSFLCTVWRSR